MKATTLRLRRKEGHCLNLLKFLCATWKTWSPDWGQNSEPTTLSPLLWAHYPKPTTLRPLLWAQYPETTTLRPLLWDHYPETTTLRPLLWDYYPETTEKKRKSLPNAPPFPWTFDFDCDHKGLDVNPTIGRLSWGESHCLSPYLLPFAFKLRLRKRREGFCLDRFHCSYSFDFYCDREDLNIKFTTLRLRRQAVVPLPYFLVC